MTNAINQEWLSANALRAYPFRADSNFRYLDENQVAIEDLSLPTYAIVDACITCPSGASARFMLSSISVMSDRVSAIFSDDTGEAAFLAQAAVQGHLVGDASIITPTTAFQDLVGKIMFGDLARLVSDTPLGVYHFTGVELEPATVRPDLRGIRSLAVLDHETESAQVSGRIKLLAGANVRLTYLPELNAIRVDAIDGSGLNQTCTCENSTIPRPISTINGISVDELVIIGDGDCLEVTTSGNTISLKDKCSKPCCGCPELEYLTSGLTAANTTAKNLEKFAADLEVKVNGFMQNMLASTKTS